MSWTDKLSEGWDVLQDDTIGQIGRTFDAIGGSPIGAAWESASHNAVTDFLGDKAFKPAGNVLLDVAVTLGYPVHQIKRGLSTVQQVSDRPDGTSAFDPSQWSQAWDRSETVSFGQAAATGTMNQFGFGPKWANDADPYDVQSQAEAQSFYHDTWAGQLTTGALDVSTYTLDPLMFVGTAARSVKAARTLIKPEAVAGAVAAARPLDQSGGVLSKIDDLTPPQVAAVTDYAGAGFDDLNLALRKGETLTGASAESAKHLDDALAGSSLASPTTLYRTVSRGSSKTGTSHFPESVKPGQIIEDKGYFSTSGTLEGAASMVDPARAGRSAAVVVELQAPAGTKALDVNGLFPDTPYAEEAELLLGRGTKYKVISEESLDIVNHSGKTVPVRYVKAELVDQAAPVRTFTKGEEQAAEKLRSLFVKTDGMSPAEMANLPEFRVSGDAGAIANFFDMANTQYPDNLIARHQLKSDIMGSILGDAASMQNIKGLGDEMAHNIYRMGEPPVTSQALAQYSRSDFGAQMIKAWNGTGEGFDSAAIMKLTAAHEAEYTRLESLMDLTGSSNKIASTKTEQLGSAIRNNKITEAMIPNGIGGRPMRFIVGNASSRVPNSVHMKDSARGFEDVSNVIAQMKHTPAAVKRQFADDWVKAATSKERRAVVQSIEARMFEDAARRWGVPLEQAQQLAREANGRQAAYSAGLKERVYSAAPTEKLVQFIDPEDDIANVYDKAFLKTHLDDTHPITDPRDIDSILKNGTNQRMLAALTEGTRLQGAGQTVSNLNRDILETAEHWATAATRVWKDSALMRLAYPLRIQVDTQLRVLSQLGMMQYMMNAKANLKGGTRFALENKEGEKKIADLLKGGVFREGNYENALAPQLMDIKSSAKGIDTTPARSMEELQGITASIRSHGGAAADIGNDISTKELRRLRGTGGWGTVKPNSPEWFDHWKRAADQIRTSPTARFAVYEEDPAVIKAFVNRDPKARKEWAEFKGQSASQDEWIARVQGHVNYYLPTPELRAAIGKPENAKSLFGIGAAEGRAAQVPAKQEALDTSKEAVKRQTDQVAAQKTAWEKTKPRSPERKVAAAELKASREKLRAMRTQRNDANADLRSVKNPVAPGAIVEDASTAGTINPGGLVEPMAVHGESYSPLAKTGLGARWAEIRQGWYQWAADAPETIIGRSPIYSHSFRTHMEQAIHRLPEESLDIQMVERLRRQADRKARQDIGNILFDATNSSNASHSLRLLSPFFSAWEDTMKKWSKLVGQNLTIPPKIAAAWNAPNNAGMVVDSEGNTVGWDGKARNDQGEVVSDNKDYRGEGENIVIPKPFGWGGAEVKDFKIRKSSANILFQGEPPWLPGMGPLVAVPTNEVAKHVWVKEADSYPLRYILPFGITDDNAARQLLPSWAKQVQDALFDTKDNAQIYTQLFQQEMVAYNKGERDTKPTDKEISGKTRNWFLLRAGLNNASPVSMQPTPKLQFYIDKAREYKREYKGEWSEKFYDDFPQYFEMATTLSADNTGISVTEEGYDAAQKYKADIKANPDKGWFFAGPANLDGTFSADVNTWMRSTEAGKGLNFRDSKDPAVAIQKSEIDKGWIQYNKMSTLINLELEKRGLSIRQKGAEDLADVKRAYTEFLGRGNQAWLTAYGERNTGGVQDIKTIAENKWKADKSFAGRSDQVALRNYFAMRSAVKAELDKREYKSLEHESNADLSDLFGAYNTTLIQSSPAFEQIYNRVLDADDISQELI